MANPVVGEILVGLVAEVVNASLGAQGVDGTQIGFGIHRTGRVVGRDGDDGAGARRDRGSQCGHVQAPVGVGGHGHRCAATHADGHFLIEIERHGQDELVAWISHRHHAVQEGHVAAGGHHQHAVAAALDAVLLRQLVSNGVKQGRVAHDGLVLVQLGIRHQAGQGRDGLRRRPVVHNALA